MNIRKRRFILLFILILALMSVYFASKLVTDASSIGDTSALPLRWGDVKYGTKPREIIASHAGETPESMSLMTRSPMVTVKNPCFTSCGISS